MRRMTKLRFKEYAHSDPERDEVVEFRMDDGWDEAEAEQYADSHNPMYEVEVSFEYDTETDELRVLEAVVEGVTLRPVNDG